MQPVKACRVVERVDHSVVVVVVEKEPIAGATIPDTSWIGNARLVIGLALDTASSRLPLAVLRSLVAARGGHLMEGFFLTATLQ